MENSSNSELVAFSDGEGLLLFGTEKKLQHLDSQFDGGTRVISSQAISRASAVLQGASIASSISGRWVKLDKDSAEALKKLGIDNPVSGVVRRGEAGLPGNPGEMIRHLRFEKGGISPAMAAGGAAIVTQVAIEAAVEEILEYLEVIDEKLDTLLRQRKIDALGRLGGIQSTLEEADELYRKSGSVSRTTWSKIQNQGADLKVIEAYALEQLSDAADQLSKKNDSKKIAELLKDLDSDLSFWLGILARSIYLQDRGYILELAHVDEFEPEHLESHREGILAARKSRISATGERLLELAGRIQDAAAVSNQVWVSNPMRARRITSWGSSLHGDIQDFARYIETDFDVENALELKTWTQSFKSLAADAVESTNRYREERRVRKEERVLERAAEIMAARELTDQADEEGDEE